MTTFDKEYGQDFKITVSQDDKDIKIEHGHNAATIAQFNETKIFDVSIWVHAKQQWKTGIETESIFSAFDRAKDALLACAHTDDINKRKSAAEANVMAQDADAVVTIFQAPAQSLSDRLETIREEAICAIETAAEKGTIELLPEDIFDADSCWIKRITKIDHPAFKNSTSKLRDQLHVEVFSGDEDDHYFNYESDLLALKTDTLVQIADFLAKN